MSQLNPNPQQILCLVTQTIGKRLPDQVNEIERDMNDDSGSKFNVELKHVTSNEQVGNLILNTKPSPQIIHIAAESPNDGGIEVPDLEHGKIDILLPNILAGFFANTKNVNCVVLNFCYSKIVAELIAKSEFEKPDGIQCVIAIDGRIEVDGAVDFSSSFYQALKGQLLNPKIIEEAFEKGKAIANARRTEGEGDGYCIFQPSFQPKPEIEIEIPYNKTIVPRLCQCKGTFKNLYEGASMWAYVKPERDDDYYILPIDDYPRNSKQGEWEVIQTVGTPEGDDDQYRIGVFMMDAEYTPEFKSLYENADRCQGFKLQSLPVSNIEFGGTEDKERIVTRQ